MGRKSLRDERRAEIVLAFARVLAHHGYAGSTMNAVAEAAGVAPGLLHHHFANKHEMLDELLTVLITNFRKRLESKRDERSTVADYIDCALKLDGQADTISAKCWVGILSEALRDPALFDRVRRHLDSEIRELTALSNGQLGTTEASALLAFIFGSLVFGSFAPRKTAGFAAESGRFFATALQDR